MDFHNTVVELKRQGCSLRAIANKLHKCTDTIRQELVLSGDMPIETKKGGRKRKYTVDDYFFQEIDSEIKLNPQRYYISLRHNKNFAYIYTKKKKLWLTLMLNYQKAGELAKNHKIINESEGVKKFYGGECVSIPIESKDNFDEIKNIIKEAYLNQKKENIS